ncbi:hypothetical protein FRC10_002535, partial [Ceratobasidium sp. 414]
MPQIAPELHIKKRKYRAYKKPISSASAKDRAAVEKKLLEQAEQEVLTRPSD